MAELSLEGRGGDLIISIESPQKNFTYGQITAPDGTGTGPFNLVNVQNYPLISEGSNVFRLASAGEESIVNAFLVTGEAIVDLAAGSSTSGPLYTILDNFDGVVLNQDALVTSDASADTFAFTNTTIVSNAVDALNSLSPKWVSEPTNSQTQTT